MLILFTIPLSFAYNQFSNIQSAVRSLIRLPESFTLFKSLPLRWSSFRPDGLVKTLSQGLSTHLIKLCYFYHNILC